MLNKLRHLLFPHHTNNHRSKVLHLSSLTAFVFFVCIFQIVITVVAKTKPGVLGFASSITPDELITLTNKQRETRGLSPLKVETHLVEVARRKGADMFAKNYWSHNSPDGTTPWWFFKAAGYDYLYAGENLARDFGDASSVIAAWMNSPTHRDNILSGRYNEIGIAVIDGVLDGQETTLVVQEFGKRTLAGAPSTTGTVTQGELMVSIPQTPEGRMSESTVLSQAKESYIDKIPFLSTFLLTKSINTSLGLLILVVLVIDALVVWYKKIPRISGKSLAHFSFFAVIIIIILLTSSGQVL